MVTSTPCSTYQEFFEVLLRVEDSENAPNDSDEEEEKGQSSHRPRKTQNFKRNGTSSGLSSGGLSSTMPRRGSRSSGGSQFHRQRDSNSFGALLCQRCNNWHFGECRRAVPLQQIQGPRGYTPMGYGGTYHYHGDVAPYSSRAYQYPIDPYYQSGYTPYQGDYTPYAPYQGGGPQWYTGGQSQNSDVASSNAGSTRQPNQPSQGQC
ncbi:hypothetical protein D8674_021605 [Pyrus ussuriensis x Pyrus communis]|uniref:Uncharacterized protein n=1 Tax=Pyrus ussuriensis x Pyrus communis TaxID=2448454 RepID=A0A5N5GIR1_9ROSA|nr:hypothetical protein D8674_021605 [Pyrus ussuriensis x Pyrus communis]